MKQNSSTAILIFSRTAREEGGLKQYGSTRSKNEKIAQQLITHTERAARLSGIPVIKKYSNNQRGQFFGNRFANAIQDAFDLGFDQIITLGTDSPGISTKIIRQLAKALHTNDVVVGPSIDGGVYALGISKSSWNKAAFEKIAWQTNSVQLEISTYAGSLNCSQTILKELLDIDDKQSFYTWLTSDERVFKLLELVRGIITRVKQNKETGAFTSPYCPSYAIARRGPPSLA